MRLFAALQLQDVGSKVLKLKFRATFGTTEEGKAQVPVWAAAPP